MLHIHIHFHEAAHFFRSQGQRTGEFLNTEKRSRPTLVAATLHTVRQSCIHCWLRLRSPKAKVVYTTARAAFQLRLCSLKGKYSSVSRWLILLWIRAFSLFSPAAKVFRLRTPFKSTTIRAGKLHTNCKLQTKTTSQFDLTST